jgi:hypothetical protein
MAKFLNIQGLDAHAGASIQDQARAPGAADGRHQSYRSAQGQHNEQKSPFHRICPLGIFQDFGQNVRQIGNLPNIPQAIEVISWNGT